MYQAFKEMIAELYNNPDFVEYCYVEGRKYKCFCSPVGNGMVFTDAGMVDECNFTLDLEVATLDRFPKQNDRVVFRQKEYVISHIEVDSANTTIKLYMVTTSKGK